MKALNDEMIEAKGYDACFLPSSFRAVSARLFVLPVTSEFSREQELSLFGLVFRGLAT